jgi:hypothetical protein
MSDDQRAAPGMAAGAYAARRETYEAAYRAWLAGMSPAERAGMARMGLGAPEHDGPILGQALDHDVGGDAVAAEVAAPEQERAPGLDARDLIARAIGMLGARANVRQALDALAMLLQMLEAPRNAGELAERHGISPSAARAELADVAAHLGLAPYRATGAPTGAPMGAETLRAVGAMRSVVSIIRRHSNAALTIDCIALATGIASTDSAEIDIAQRHGLERAAVAKRCVEISRKLNLPPSASMRPVGARQSYSSARTARIRREELLYANPTKSPR